MIYGRLIFMPLIQSSTSISSRRYTVLVSNEYHLFSVRVYVVQRVPLQSSLPENQQHVMQRPPGDIPYLKWCLYKLRRSFSLWVSNGSSSGKDTLKKTTRSSRIQWSGTFTWFTRNIICCMWHVAIYLECSHKTISVSSVADTMNIIYANVKHLWCKIASLWLSKKT